MILAFEFLLSFESSSSFVITKENDSSIPYTPILKSRKGKFNPKNNSKLSSIFSSRLNGCTNDNNLVGHFKDEKLYASGEMLD